MGALKVGSVNINYSNANSHRHGYSWKGPGSRSTSKTVPCNNQSTCSVNVNNGLMGDPAPGQAKKFTMTANCVIPNQGR